MDSMQPAEAAGGPTAPAAPGRGVGLATLAGLLGGLLAWSVGESTVRAFRPPTYVQIGRAHV